jgi:hypothetical protein
MQANVGRTLASTANQGIGGGLLIGQQKILGSTDCFQASANESLLATWRESSENIAR